VRAVLDPNVLVAALLSASGAPAQLLRGWLSGEFELIVSDRLLAELERVLAYPRLRRRIPPRVAAEYMSLLERGAARVLDPPDPSRRTADPDDDYLIALAESASAFLVSGDHHLLALTSSLPVRSVATFLAQLGH
jgi:uncharacterized protein